MLRLNKKINISIIHKIVNGNKMANKKSCHRKIIGIMLIILGIIGILFGLFLSIGCYIEGEKYQRPYTGYLLRETEEGALYLLGYFYGLGIFGLGTIFLLIGISLTFM
jgi:hypothetical protein